MIKSYIMDLSFDKWIHQNTINDDIYWVDAMDGCLIDNYFIETKNGVAILKEKYINAWTSQHVLYFARNKNHDDIMLLYQMWDDLKEQLESA